MKDWFIQHKLFVIIAVVIVLGGGYYFYFYAATPPANTSLNGMEPSAAPKAVEKPVQQTQPVKQEVSIMVDVKGQIKHPGVYQSSVGERVIDVIGRAGGVTKNADESQVNFAQHVQDEMVIYIPAKGEEGLVAPVTAEGGAAAPGGNTNNAKIDLNKADATELQTLPGIGQAKAAAIIDYREKSGSFKTIEDLKNISGIGDKTFEKLKDLITVH